MYAEITTALASIKSLVEVAKLTSDVKTSTQVLQKTTELNITILSLQEKVSAILMEKDSLLQEKKELEQKIAQFEHWETEAARYELKELAPSILVYAVKPSTTMGEPEHYLCTKCFQDKKKSILQKARHEPRKTFCCPSCGMTLGL